ncbi:MAG: NAD(P)-dependent oxidoreductase [Deltaproteobacteria bacterium]|nr:NAD(P)-dependent oxidoreductase [Deltaproteobacteria bacterium]
MPTIGILYPGDMGHNVARVLLEDGFSVVTTLAGRSERTRRLCAGTMIEVLDSLQQVCERADIVISIVPPAAATAAAADFVAAAAHLVHPPLYVDANAISPMTTQEVGAIVTQAGIPYLDACIIGPARDVRGRCTFHVSGPDAQRFEACIGTSIKTRQLGDRIGQASAFKIAFSGLNKGLAALLFELTAAGKEFGFLDDLLQTYTALLPGIMQALEWLVPTYPLHSARRADEMAELADMLEHYGFSSVMASGARDTLAAVGKLRLAERHPERGEQDWTMREVIEAIARDGALRR